MWPCWHSWWGTSSTHHDSHVCTLGSHVFTLSSHWTHIWLMCVHRWLTLFTVSSHLFPLISHVAHTQLTSFTLSSYLVHTLHTCSAQLILCSHSIHICLQFAHMESTPGLHRAHTCPQWVYTEITPGLHLFTLGSHVSVFPHSAHMGFTPAHRYFAWGSHINHQGSTCGSHLVHTCLHLVYMCWHLLRLIHMFHTYPHKAPCDLYVCTLVSRLFTLSSAGLMLGPHLFTLALPHAYSHLCHAHSQPVCTASPLVL